MSFEIATQPLNITQINVNLPLTAFPLQWQSRTTLSKNTQSFSFFQAIASCCCLPIPCYDESVTYRRYVQINILNGTCLFITHDEVGDLLSLNKEEIARRCMTTTGIHQLGMNLLNFLSFQRANISRFPVSFQRIQDIANILKPHLAQPNGLLKNVNHYRKATLRDIGIESPHSLERGPSNNIFALLKILIGDGKYKKVCLAAEVNTLFIAAHATIDFAQIDEPNKMRDLIESEFDFQSRLNSPYVVKMFHRIYYLSKYNKLKMGIMMEWCNAGDLLNLINNHYLIGKPHFYNILEDCLSALQFLESEGIHHRDIKLENIFLYVNEKGELRAKLGDFGFATKLKNELLDPQNMGTLLYCAPEYLVGYDMLVYAKKELLILSQQKANPSSEQKLPQQQKMPDKILAQRRVKPLTENELKHLLDTGLRMVVSTKTDMWGMGIIFWAMRKIYTFPLLSGMPDTLLCATLKTLTQSQIDSQFQNVKSGTLGSLNRLILSIDPGQRPTPAQALIETRKCRQQNLPFE